MKTFRYALFCLLLTALGVGTATAAVPPMINYQGKLMQPSGVPVPDNTYSMTFAIYGVPTGGTAMWSETNSSVQVKGGLFAVLLGSNTPIPGSILDGSDRWFGVKVGADPEMSPRQQVASVPYAQTSGNGTPTGGIIMWSGSVASIPPGWALCDGTNGTPDLRDRFLVGAGSTYAVGATGGVASLDLAHSHMVNSHTHTIASDGSHSHTYSGTTGNGKNWGGGSYNQAGSVYYVDHVHDYSGTTSASGTHNHTGATGAASPGTSSALGTVDNRPPYYALCFIMKLGY